MSGPRDRLERYAEGHSQFGATSPVPDLLRSTMATASVLRGPIVDIGCGEGGTLAAVRASFPELPPLIGLELSETRARICRERRLTVALSDALLLPIKDQSVAMIVSRHVIEHVDDDRAALDEIRRTLMTDGCLYLETPLRLPGAWYPYRNPAGTWVLDPTHVREYRTTSEVQRLLTDAGLECREIDVQPIRFPLGQLLLRIPGVRSTPGKWRRRLLRLTRPAIRIPRYHEIRCFAVKRAAIPDA